MNKTTVVILYRVLSHYRLPVFEKLAQQDNIELTVLHGCDFPGTKIFNSKSPHEFNSMQLKSLPIKVSTTNGLAVAPFSPGLFFALHKLKPDVIVCEGASNLPNNIIAYIYAKMFNTRIVQWGLGEIKNWKKSLLRRILDRLIVAMELSANACLTYSSRGYEYYRRIGVPDKRIFVAVNVVDTERISMLQSKLNSDQIYTDAHCDADFIVLFVGALNRGKKVDMLISAFQQFSLITKFKTKLFIVGDGDKRQELEALAKADSEANIHFIGQVIDDVSKYFIMADVFVLPGLGGLAISEAMAYGLPVIASIGDGCEVDLLADGGGILDEQLSEKRLVDHLVVLASSRDKLEIMKHIARKTIKNKYNTETYVKGLMDSIHYQ